MAGFFVSDDALYHSNDPTLILGEFDETDDTDYRAGREEAPRKVFVPSRWLLENSDVHSHSDVDAFVRNYLAG